jgi:hypothetical protein
LQTSQTDSTLSQEGRHTQIELAGREDSEVGQRHHVGMTCFRGEPGLPQKTLLTFLIMGRKQDLDGHRAVEDEMTGLIESRQ